MHQPLVEKETNKIKEELLLMEFIKLAAASGHVITDPTNYYKISIDSVWTVNCG